MTGGKGYVDSDDDVGRIDGPHKGPDQLRVDVHAAKMELKKERASAQDLMERLKESEHKRQEHLKRNMDLQGKIVGLEHEIQRLKQRFKDLMMKKASGIMREEFDILERKYNECLKELKGYRLKEDRINTKVDNMRFHMDE